MKKFLIKSVVFLSILLNVFGYLSLSYKIFYYPDTDYMATIIDKHKRLEQPSLSRKQDSFPQLTVVLRTDFHIKFEGPLQGRFLNWSVIARVQSWLECKKPFCNSRKALR